MMNLRKLFYLVLLCSICYCEQNIYAEALTEGNRWIQLKTELTESVYDSSRINVVKVFIQHIPVQQGSPIEMYDSLLLLKDVFETEPGLVDFYHTLAVSYSMVGAFDKAELLVKNSVDLLDAEKEPERLSKSYYLLGLIYNKKNDLYGSLNYLMESVKLQEKLPSTIQLAHAYNAMGSVYELMERYDKAMQYYQKAMAEFMQLGNKRAQGLAYNNMGLLQQRNKKYQDALTYLLQAKVIFDMEKDPRLQTTVANNLASVYADLHEYSKAEEMYMEVMPLAQKRNDPVLLASIFGGLGNVYLMQGDLDKAENYFRKSLHGLQPVSAMRIYKSLAMIDTLQKDYKMFVRDYRAYDILKDSIYNEQKLMKILEMEKSYESRLKDQEIELLQKKNKLKKKQLYLMMVAVGAVLMMFLALFFRYRALIQQRKLSKLMIEKHEVEKLRLEENYYAEQKIRELQKNKYTNDLNEKSRELATSSLYVINKNQVLQTIKEDLLEIIKNNKAMSALQPILKNINANLTLDEDWEQFKLQFEKVNPDFLSRLNQQFPQLTDSDIRFLTYMRINLSTKEIAQMLNISSKSANMTRYRIRRKLDLEKEDDLMEFVRNV